MTFREVKRLAGAVERADMRIAVAGDSATQFLAIAIKGALKARGVDAEVFEAPYNQVERQLLLPDSELRQFNPDYTIVWETVEKWWLGGETVENRINHVRALCDSFPGQLVYLNAAPFADGVFGSYAAAPQSFTVQVRRFNCSLDELSLECDRLALIDLHSLVAQEGYSIAHDAAVFSLSDMVLTPDAQAHLGERIADALVVRRGRMRKCVVIDLDNTLWGGIVGEDGLAGLQIGGTPIGKAHLALQRWLLRLKDRGVLLAVCSKNDDLIAREVFEKHPDMQIRMEDIACFVANWENKATNLAHIQRVLNIGFDSMVFLDDNPAERLIVRQAYPEVAVPELPTDVSQWIGFLAAANLFETASSSPEDRNRTRQYREEAQRRELQLSFSNEGAYLASLGMEAETIALDDFQIPRAAQLTQRSNQFNLRTVRYSEDELRRLAKDENVLARVFRLRDRFGDNGLVSVFIGRVQGDALFIDTWLMSCRVLGRGLENLVLNKVVELSVRRGLKKLVGEYRPTRKNGLVANLYPRLGFVPTTERCFELTLSGYRKMETKINEKN